MTEAHIIIEDLASNDPAKIIKQVAISGQLDESNIDERSKEVYAIIEQNPKNLFLIFDFQGLEYMNSKSIGYMTDWYGKITEGGGKMVIAQGKPNILDILNVVGLTQLIPNYATIDEAKFAVTNTGGAPSPAPAIAPAAQVQTAAPEPTPVVAPVVAEPVTPAPVATEPTPAPAPVTPVPTPAAVQTPPAEPTATAPATPPPSAA